MKGCEGQISLFDFVELPKKEVDIDNVGIGALFRYLRYGPHTMVPEARNKCKEYLESVGGKLPKCFIDVYGNPKQWNNLPCKNCEYCFGGVCNTGGHTCHYEYGVLICDGFKQTIDARPEKSICQFSQHECNREELWKVADTLDALECPHVCCRKCNVVCCGARCNGSEEPSANIEEVMKYSAEEYARAIAQHLIDYCKRWDYSEKIAKQRENNNADTFKRLFCKITRNYYVPIDKWHYNVEFCKDNTVNIKRCGRDYVDRPVDATIQLKDILNEL